MATIGEVLETAKDLEVAVDAIIHGFQELEVEVLKQKRDQAEALEILTLLAETLPRACNCDGGYGDDGRGTRECLPHRAARWLESL